jgi:hypothetical protein
MSCFGVVSQVFIRGLAVRLAFRLALRLAFRLEMDKQFLEEGLTYDQ